MFKQRLDTFSGSRLQENKEKKRAQTVTDLAAANHYTTHYSGPDGWIIIWERTHFLHFFPPKLRVPILLLLKLTFTFSLSFPRSCREQEIHPKHSLRKPP